MRNRTIPRAEAAIWRVFAERIARLYGCESVAFATINARDFGNGHGCTAFIKELCRDFWHSCWCYPARTKETRQLFIIFVCAQSRASLFYSTTRSAGSEPANSVKNSGPSNLVAVVLIVLHSLRVGSNFRRHDSAHSKRAGKCRIVRSLINRTGKNNLCATQ